MARHLVAKDIEFDAGLWEEVARRAERWFGLEVQEMPFAKIIERYKGSKRKAYERARDELFERGLQSRHSLVRMFVKVERFPLDKLVEKAPRAIQYRGPHFNLCVMKYTIPFEEVYYPELHYGVVSGTRVVAKGLNNEQRARLFVDKSTYFKRPVYTMLDHSAFDSTIRVEHLKSTHRKYAMSFGRKCRRLFRHQLVNVGYSKNGIKYVVHGTRMSGDADTGLGNTIINLDAISGVLWKSGIEKFDILVDGDDAIVITEEGQEINFSLFSRLGFQTKYTQTRNIHHVDFCQSRLILRPDPIFVRNPARVMSNSTVALKKYPDMRGWIAAYGECECSVVPGVPVLQEYCRFLRRVSEKRYYDQDLERRMAVGEEQPVSDIARLTFMEAWGVPPPIQVEMEEQFTANDIKSFVRACYPANCLQNDESISRKRAWLWIGNELGCRSWWYSGEGSGGPPC